jgi:esterase/lipase superfamily enzyme
MDVGVFSRYRIVRRIGTGGMGAVYEAEDLKLGRQVALKVFPKLGTTRQALEQFRREARAASALNHPNICAIYEIDEVDRHIFVAMELLEGQTLRERINRKSLNTDTVLDLSVEIADALAVAHQSGIIHRDINPANIFITKRNHAKILDFGLARISLPPEVPSSALTSEDAVTTPAVLGSIPYMSPELVRGMGSDARSDLFSFGAVLYEMATGSQPFLGETAALTFDAILNRTPISPLRLNPDLSLELEFIIGRSLVKDRNRRYQSAAEIRVALQSASVGLPSAKMKRKRISPLPKIRLKPTTWDLLTQRTVESDPEVIRVLYATDRKCTGLSEPKRFFANERAEGGTLSLGVCEVTIPKSDRHKIGGLEKPSLFRLEFKEDPAKHVILVAVERWEEGAFFTELQQRVGKSQRHEAFIFVHGYHVSFEEAACRTAQLACDLHFDGAPILFSWPSRGKWWQYAVDETNVTWSVPHLESFLRAVAMRSGARTVHLIAHSMGNRALTSTLELLVAKNSIPPQLFRHIVLTAPDIDRETFQQLAAAIVPAGERLTMYSNRLDRALLLSKLFHLYGRAGSGIVVLDGMDTIDASSVDTSLTRHSYFGSNRTVLADIFSLISEGKPPKLRFGMTERHTEKGPYYKFRP